MSRTSTTENPTRFNGYLPRLTVVTLIALKNRLKEKSDCKTLSRVVVKEGNRLKISEEELSTAEVELDSRKKNK